MRDEIDARLWADHHDGFEGLVDSAIAALRDGLARIGGWDGTTQQLLSLVAAFLVTALTFNTTAA